jgi:hypothetical protein
MGYELWLFTCKLIKWCTLFHQYKKNISYFVYIYCVVKETKWTFVFLQKARSIWHVVHELVLVVGNSLWMDMLCSFRSHPHLLIWAQNWKINFTSDVLLIGELKWIFIHWEVKEVIGCKTICVVFFRVVLSFWTFKMKIYSFV